MILNLHEWWLLRSCGVGRREQQQLVAALLATGQSGGEVDLLAELGGYTLGKRSVKQDLAALFDELIGPDGARVHGVAYGSRRYRKAVILAAALHRAGVSASTFRVGVGAGCRRLGRFQELARVRS